MTEPTYLKPRPGQSRHKMLTVEQVAERLTVSPMTVYRLIHTGQLRAYRFERSIRVDAPDLEDYIRGAVIEWGVA